MDDWITYLEAEPKSEPFLSIAAAWKADKARLAEAEALIAETRQYVYHWPIRDKRARVAMLGRLDDFLAADTEIQKSSVLPDSASGVKP